MKRLARNLVLVVAVAAALPVFAPRTVHAVGTTYYVDPSGNDGNAGDSTHPFQHIQQCATVMQAGDTCTINSGTYRETVTPAHSGTTAAPITYQAATGATVRVDGTDYVNGWSQVTDTDVATLAASNSFITGSPFATAVHSRVVYKAHVVINSALANADQVFVGDQVMNEAQWPDPSADPLSPNVELARSGSNNAQVSDPALNQAAGYWNGANVYIQETFKADTGTVTTSTPGSIAVTGYYGTYPDHWDLCEGINPDDTRYYLWGKLTELNAPTEWYYDSGSSTLYFRPSSGTLPADSTVTVKQRPLAFDLSAASNTVISGLHVFGATIQTGDGSTGVNLTSLQVDHPSHFMLFTKDPNQSTSSSCDDLSAGDTTTGIILRGTGNTVQNSTIEYSTGDGVALLGSGNTVTNNVIHDVDTSGGRPAGVYLIGNNQTITHNTIYNVGRGGIESNSNFAPATLHSDTISYNDISSYGRLEQDDGAIYVCCNMDMSGTAIHHNWVHDNQTYPGVLDRGTIGVYIDGGTNGGASGLLIYCNVGWGNGNGTVGLVTSPVNNTKVLNNDGGVFLSGITSSTGSLIADNIGDVAQWNGTTANIVPNSNNLQDVNTNNPQYVDEAGRNYTLSSTSPARKAGITESPGTDGATETPPSEGAYQYGATPWQTPGASGQPAAAIRPEWGAGTVASTGNWQTQWAQPIGRMDSHPSNPFDFMTPGTTGSNTGNLHFTFTTPAANGHTIDKVYVRLYARMHRNQPTTTASTVLTMPGLGTVFDAGGQNFESVGVPVSVDISSQVAGNWASIPTSADLSGTLGVEAQTTTAGQPDYSDIEVYAVEIYIQAH